LEKRHRLILNRTAGILGACAAEESAAATREKTDRSGITACARGAALGLPAQPDRTRFSHFSLRRLLPHRLLAFGTKKVLSSDKNAFSGKFYQGNLLFVRNAWK
jgi:hypothetical protein